MKDARGTETNVFMGCPLCRLFSGQRAGTAQRGTKDGEEKKKEQFQLTHAKVKVILMDKEEDKQGEKKKEKKSFCPSLTSTTRG